MAAAIPAVAAWGASPQARNSEAAHETLLENLMAFVSRMVDPQRAQRRPEQERALFRNRTAPSEQERALFHFGTAPGETYAQSA